VESRAGPPGIKTPSCEAVAAAALATRARSGLAAIDCRAHRCGLSADQPLDRCHPWVNCAVTGEVKGCEHALPGFCLGFAWVCLGLPASAGGLLGGVLGGLLGFSAWQHPKNARADQGASH
jgi:hypothetical protein